MSPSSPMQKCETVFFSVYEKNTETDNHFQINLPAEAFLLMVDRNTILLSCISSNNFSLLKGL